MAMHRFFLAHGLGSAAATTGAAAFELPLDAGDVHHAVRVARLRADEHVVVVTPDRVAVEVRLADVSPQRLTATVVRTLGQVPEPDVTLFQGLAKGASFDLVVEKAIEVGVAGIVPVAFERSVVRLGEAKAVARGARWRRIARSSAMQSQRSFVPPVEEPLDLSGLASRVSALDVTLVAWEEASEAPGIADALRAAGVGGEARVGVIVGPEGGLTSEEVASLQDSGAVAVTLGQTVLRTETAGIVAVALCVHELGGLGAR